MSGGCPMWNVSAPPATTGDQPPEVTEKSAEALCLGDVVVVDGVTARVSDIRWTIDNHRVVTFEGGDEVAFRTPADAEAAVFEVTPPPRQSGGAVGSIASDKLRVGDVVLTYTIPATKRVEAIESDGDYWRILVFDNGDRMCFATESLAEVHRWQAVSADRHGDQLPPLGAVGRAHAANNVRQRLQEMTPQRRMEFVGQHLEDMMGSTTWTPSGIPRPPWAKQEPRPGRFTSNLPGSDDDRWRAEWVRGGRAV
jgi:hypothetical protein